MRLEKKKKKKKASSHVQSACDEASFIYQEDGKYINYCFDNWWLTTSMDMAEFLLGPYVSVGKLVSNCEFGCVLEL